MCLHLCFEMNICRLNLENYNKLKNFILVSLHMIDNKFIFNQSKI